VVGWSYSDAVARREWGSGSIYRTRSGRWRVAVRLGSDPFGKPIRKEWQVRTEAQARTKLRDIQRRLAGGLPAEASRMTLGIYAQEWLNGVTPTVRPATAAFYRTLAEVHLEPLASHQLIHIGPADIRKLVADELAEGYATRTVRGVLDVLRMILKAAVVDGILARNVAELVKPPQLIQAEPAHFTAEQARRFLEVAADDPLGSFYAVALGTGLRRAELLGLSWRDVDLRTPHVIVRRSKTEAGVRHVPLPPFAVAALERLDRQPGPIWPVRPEVVTRRMRELCEKAGLPRLTLHGLRHSTASILYAEGVPEFVIQSILGHSKVGMTKHYTHVEQEQQREAMERLGRAVG
jgi:integrase